MPQSVSEAPSATTSGQMTATSLWPTPRCATRGDGNLECDQVLAVAGLWAMLLVKRCGVTVLKAVRRPRAPWPRETLKAKPLREAPAGWPGWGSSSSSGQEWTEAPRHGL